MCRVFYHDNLQDIDSMGKQGQGREGGGQRGYLSGVEDVPTVALKPQAPMLRV